MPDETNNDATTVPPVPEAIPAPPASAPSETVFNLQERVIKLELQVERIVQQVNRLTSHIESEVGLARSDINRVEVRLFGKDEDDVYGGRIGQLHRSQSNTERRFAYAMGALFAANIMFQIVQWWLR